jgi:hypothetical protein
MQSFVVTLEAIKADNPSSLQMQSIIETAEELGYESPTGAMGIVPQTPPRPTTTLMECIDGYKSEHKHIGPAYAVRITRTGFHQTLTLFLVEPKRTPNVALLHPEDMESAGSNCPTR